MWVALGVNKILQKFSTGPRLIDKTTRLGKELSRQLPTLHPTTMLHSMWSDLHALPLPSLTASAYRR